MRYLVIRIGEAIGDIFVITPLIRHLSKLGHEIYVLTGKIGEDILRYNPLISKIIIHQRDSVPLNKLGEYFEGMKSNLKCDKMVDLCESVECRVILHPSQPQYNYPLQERKKYAERNVYELTMEKAGFNDFNVIDFIPEIYFDDDEISKFMDFRANYIGKKLILWCLSGSGIHKFYPYYSDVIKEILEWNENVHFITVGDEACQILELLANHPRILNKSGEWSLRETFLACKYVSLVIAPETGILHAAGCFKTPKIALFSHTNHEVLTKYFYKVYPIHPQVYCHPCFHFIMNSKVQCEYHHASSSVHCMHTLNPKVIISKIEEILYFKKQIFVYAS